MLPTITAGARQREAGFTLIELSIVLVIIGLLIGGVLQGQEMINNTRIKTTVSQTDSIQAAVQTFEDKFGSLPGDFGDADVLGATKATSAGADNGVIDSATGSSGVTDLNGSITASSEAGLVFEHLNIANLLQGVRETSTANLWVMNTKISGGALDVASFNFSDNADGVGIRMRDATTQANGIVAPADAFSLDTKYDDGDPQEGRWEALDGGNVDTAGDCADANGWGTVDDAVCIVVLSIR